MRCWGVALLSRVDAAKQFYRERQASLEAGRLATRGMIAADQLSSDELQKLAAIYHEWVVGVAYSVGDIVQYGGKLFIVLQAHVSQADWSPPLVPALFKPTGAEGVIPDWVQPTGAHDAYNMGDLVKFNSKVYKSLINGNTWSPTAYPAGWALQ